MTTGGTYRIPPPGPHGDDALAVAGALGIAPDDLLDLALTLNPVAPDPAPVVARHAGAVRRYPDERRAVDAVAAAMAIDRHRLVLTNGGAEAIALVAADRPTGWVEDPEFSLYRRHLREVRPGAPRWASNPRNPTGRLAADDERATVWDEAFFPLATGRWTRGDEDAVVVGSLTKVLACPGLRIGYVIAPDAGAARRIRDRRPAWSLNALAAAALPDLLAGVDLDAWHRRVTALRAALVDALRRHGYDPLPSDAPFVLVPHAAGLRDALARRRVLVRDCSSFGLPDHVRIAVPADEGLTRLDAALDEVHG